MLCAALAVLHASGRADESLPRTISVAGEGIVFAPPDMATVQTGVVTQAAKARDALDANNAAVERIMSALAAHNVADKDIQTASFNVSPEYERGPRGQRRPEIIGYRVTNLLRVQVRNLTDLGGVLDACIAAGSNQISDIRFDIDDPSSVLNEARRLAIADGRSRAAVYAGAADVRLGRVISISEQSPAIPRPQHLRGAMLAEAAAVPIATGQQEMRVTVHMVFALDQ